jgi:hypothetical protein
MDARKMVSAHEAREMMDDITPTEWDPGPVGQSERRAEDRRRAARLAEMSTWGKAHRWVGTVIALHDDVRRFAALLAAATAERDDARAEVETLRAEAALLREIAEGRTRPPGQAMLTAMLNAGLRLARRWHAVDADGRPCAWPTVTP